MSTPSTNAPNATDAQLEVLSQTPSVYASAVRDVLRRHDDAAEQVLTLRRLVSERCGDLPLEIGELIVNTEDQEEPPLELYIRITTDRDEFETARRDIRTAWATELHGNRSLVFPMILRRVADVRSCRFPDVRPCLSSDRAV